MANAGVIKAMVRAATLEPRAEAMLGWLAAPGVNIRAELLSAAKRQGLVF